MKQYAMELWRRAKKTLSTARRIADSDDPDAAASRAYYAAFYAVSALFALENRDFTKHSAVEAAVHRDLVNKGRWSAELGEDYYSLRKARATGDYGGLEHVETHGAMQALDEAQRILDAVRNACPELDNPDDKL